jgi:hypothetical protein
MRIGIFFVAFLTFLSAEIRIGTGNKNGNYFKMGEDLKKVCSNLRISVLETGGSADNLSRILKDKIDIGFFQNDTLYSYEILQFDKEKSLLNYNEISKSRVMAIYGIGKEFIFVLTKENRKITKLSDLENKKVLIGSPKSGTNRTANFLRNYFSVGNWNFIEKDFDESDFYSLKNGDIDAIFIVGSKELKNLKNLPSNVIINDFYTDELQKPFGKADFDDTRLFYINSIIAVGKNREKGKKIRDCISENIVKLQTGNFSNEWKKVDIRDKNTKWYNLK